MGFVAAFLEQRELGRVVFLVGFYIAALGVVSGMVSLPLPEEFEHLRTSLRVGIAGFAIAVLALVLGTLTQKENFSDFFVYAGAVVVLGAVVLMCVAIVRSKR